MDYNEIVQPILEKVKGIGESYSQMKENYDEMRSSFEQLKKVVDSNPGDVLAKEKMDKFAAEIAARQDAMDKVAQKKEAELQARIDQIEVSMKRPGNLIAGNDSEFKAAQEFFKNAASVKSNDKGVNYEELSNLKVDIDLYKAYNRTLEKYLRKFGGSRELLLEPAELKTLIAGSDQDGGYTVTPQMSNEIIKRMYEIDPMRQLASVETISTSAIEWLCDTGDASSGWEGETVATTNVTTPQLGKKRISVNSLATRPRASQILLEDSGINIEAWLAAKVADRFARDEAAAFVSGDGIGKPRGFLTYADGTAWGTIELVHMGAAANLTADGFIAVKYHLIEQFLNRGTWLMARSTVQAALRLKDGAGNYLWQPSFQAGQPSSILGLPVRMSTTMPAVSANALSVALADWKEAYMIVDRLGITVQRDPYTQKPLVEFYFRKRVGGDVVNYDAIKIGTIEA